MSVVIGLGGNLGGDDAVRARFVRAREALGQLGAVTSALLYRTAPIYPRSPASAGFAPSRPPQPSFLNTAVRVRIADAQPAELVATVLELERLLGRDRRGEARWGPRAIDLDVLVWGERVIRTPELEVPHPRLAERRFALAPLVDLVGEAFEIPGVGPAGAALARVADQEIELIGDW